MGVNNITEEEIKETVIGLFPATWEITDIGSLFSVQQGKALSKKHQQGKSPYPFLRTSNVLWGRLVLSTLDEMDFTDAERERYELEAGDLLICEGGEIGRTAIWNNEIENCYMQNHVFRVRAKSKEVYPKFYMYWMQAGLLLLNLYQGYGNKTTIPNLSKTRLSSFPVPLAPLPEQKNIACVLSKIQEAIEVQERVINAARELKRSLMHRLFTYGPYEEECPTKETVFGEIPESWDTASIAGLTELKYGYQTSIPKVAPVNGTEIISTAEITFDGLLDLSNIRTVEIPEHLIDRYTVEEGDLLFNWRNAQKHVGKTALVSFNPTKPMIFASFIIRIRVGKDVSVKYLHYLLTYFRDRGVFFTLSRRAVNQANFNANELGELEIPIPNLQVQKDIASKLEVAERKIQLEEARHNALKSVFKSLLHQLMTGQIRVNDLVFKKNE